MDQSTCDALIELISIEEAKRLLNKMEIRHLFHYHGTMPPKLAKMYGMKVKQVKEILLENDGDCD